MINNSTRNKGNTFPLEIKGLFYTETTKSFPREMVGSVSNGKFVKRYIKRNPTPFFQAGSNLTKW